MIFLLLTIFFSASLTLLFKLFDRWGIPLLPVVVVNYWVCVITGAVMMGRFPVSAESVRQPWLPWAAVLGGSFFLIFNLIGRCTRTAGVTVSTVAQKLSLVIPVVASFVLYGEERSALKIVGILAAFPAVYLATRAPAAAGGKTKNISLLLPAAIFLGSGGADALVKWVEQRYLKTEALQATYIVHVFLAAALLGTVVLLFLAARRKLQWSVKAIAAGILLGVPNYFSIWAFIRLLHAPAFLQSSAAIPVANVGVVLTASLAAMLLFREKAGTARLFGLLLSVVSILLIAFSDLRG